LESLSIRVIGPSRKIVGSKQPYILGFCLP
jgi:hypothetical protein